MLWQFKPAAGGGGGVTDHGALTGLADDDHTQYHNDARGDVRYNTKSEITTLLAGKANTSHTHVAANITDFNTAALAAAPAETVTTEGARINGATAKTTPVDADMIGLMDSAASNVLKKLSWLNVKATLKTYFDTLYSTVSHSILAHNGFPGGTTTFLRGDGTFAAPPGGGGGLVAITGAPATDQADWNPAGFGATVDRIVLQPTTNSFLTGLVAGAANQVVTLFNDSTFVVYIEGEGATSTAANRFKRSPTPLWLLPQESMTFRYSSTLSRWVLVAASRHVADVDPTMQLFLPNTTTTVSAVGIHSGAVTATASTIAAVATPTNEFDEYAVTQFTNSTAAGTTGFRSNVQSHARGATAGRQGYFHAGRVKFNAMGNVSGCVRAGLLSSSAVSTTLNSALLDCLLIGAEVAETTLQIVYNDNAGAASKVNLGANFPVPSATASYEYCFYCAPGSTVAQYMVRRLDTRFVAQGTLTTDLPRNTVLQGMRIEAMVGATAAANTVQMSYLLLCGI